MRPLAAAEIPKRVAKKEQKAEPIGWKKAKNIRKYWCIYFIWEATVGELVRKVSEEDGWDKYFKIIL